MNRRTNVAILLLILSAWGCANKVTPAGGEKDVKAPVFKELSPPNNSVNFHAGKITITFDEYVQLKESGKQIFISPPIQPAPAIVIRKKSIIIEIPDSLKPAATYSINFGNSITDLNEGNALPGFTYIFSTGSFIDSLKMTGVVLNAQTKKPEPGVTALVYDASIHDTLFLQSLPLYYAKTNESGVFTVNSMAPGSYRVYALNDKNSNYRLDMKDETAGFFSDPVVLTDSANVIINIGPVRAARQTIISSIIESPGKLVTVFANPVNNVQWRFLNEGNFEVKQSLSAMGDSIILYTRPAITDSARMTWMENGIVVDTVFYSKPRETPKQQRRESYTSMRTYPGRSESLKEETEPFIQWSQPVIKLDTTKISIFRDSVEVPFSVKFTDSLQTIMVFKSLWQQGRYQLKLDPGAITDWNEYINDSVNFVFNVAAGDQKGSISFRFTSDEQLPLLLQLVNDKDEIIRQRNVNRSLNGEFANVTPGVFKLRVIKDNNNNGRWDAGDYAKRKQPEEVIYNPDPITVRANWDVEIEWNIPGK